jgi:hypothetical protein
MRGHRLGHNAPIEETLALLAMGQGQTPPADLQTPWFQDYVAGKDTNDGLTAATAVQHFAEIYRRWQGGVAGTRPRIPQSVNIFSISPVPPGLFTDPLLRLADVDMAPGAVITVKPLAPTVKRTGAITAVTTPFARTATGRLKITDAGVADWTSDIDRLFVDATAGTTTWVTAAPAANTSNLAAPRVTFNDTMTIAFLNAGLGAPVAVAPTNPYSIITPQDVYLGTGSMTRQWPIGGAAGGFNLPSAFLVEGFRAVSQGRGDVTRISADGVFSPDVAQCGANVVLANCRIDTELQMMGGVFAANCFTSSDLFIGGPSSVVSTSLLGGYSRASVFLLGGGNVDDDFSLLGVGPITFAVEGDRNFFGNVGFYGDGSGEAIFNTADADVTFGPDFEAQAIFYGQTLGQPFYIGQDNSFGHINGQTAVVTFKFDTLTFKLGGQTQGWGFDRAAGTYVGPTTFTPLHVDAALAAGTGFGGNAIDPKTGAFLAIFGS